MDSHGISVKHTHAKFAPIDFINKKMKGKHRFFTNTETPFYVLNVYLFHPHFVLFNSEPAISKLIVLFDNKAVSQVKMVALFQHS